MIEPVKFWVWVANENVEIFTELLMKKKIKFEVAPKGTSITQVDIVLHPRKYFDKDWIRELHDDWGRSYSYIAEKVGCSKSYVEKVINENSDD